MSEIRPGYVAIGRVLGALGISGDVKVEPLARAKVLSRGREVVIAGRITSIERVRRRGRVLHIKLAGVNDRRAAAALQRAYLQVPERELEPLPTGEYYRFQLIGLRVCSIDGQDLGFITDVLSTTGNDVLVVNGPLGEVFLPFVDDVIQQIDAAEGRVIIEIVPGLLP